MYKIFAHIKRLWEGLGSPCASMVRHVRYNWLGRFWPVYETDVRKTRGPLYQYEALPPQTVAVIIPCHNYGRFLAEAIESVLAQTVQPTQIVVIDDASTDETQAVLAEYKDTKVQSLHVDYRSLVKTRNRGAQETQSTYLLYLDADDRLPPNYIEECLRVMSSPAVGLAYADRAQFGESSLYLHAPAFSAELLISSNFIPSNALIRRQAFDLVGGYRDFDGMLEDWDFNKRVISMGYIAERARTYFHQRMHDESMGFQLKQRLDYSYATIAGLSRNRVLIFTPFAGRESVLDRYIEGLKNLQYSPSLVHVYWYNTSNDPAFDRRLRQEIAHLPFSHVRYNHSPLPYLWNHSPASLIEKRIENTQSAEYYYQLAVVRAYNTMIRQCTTDYVLTVEDDMHLNPSTLHALQSAMDQDVAAVIAPYKSGFYPRYEVWEENGDGTIRHHKEKGYGIAEVGGCGFGCTLFRTSMLRQITPLATGVLQNPPQWYDQISYRRLRSFGRVLCNWDAEVEHMETERYKEKLSPGFT